MFIIIVSEGQSLPLFQPHDIPMSKWEVISMDFVVGFPCTSLRHNVILVTIDKLKKSVHFISIKINDHVPNVEMIFMVFIDEIVHFHGLPKSIMSNRDSMFTSRYCTSLQSTMGTEINLNIAYYHV